MKPNAPKYYQPDPAYFRLLVTHTGKAQNEVARLIGIAPRSIRAYLAGDRPIPYTVQYSVEQLCSYLPPKPPYQPSN